MPTEAQWEYACRADTATRYSFGDEEALLGEYAWFEANGGADEGAPHPVGRKKPNPWGLYDTHGDVGEWCRDYYQTELPGGSDPEVTKRGSLRVYRGGSWFSAAVFCRSAHRGKGPPSLRDSDVGFRVAQVPSGR